MTSAAPQQVCTKVLQDTHFTEQTRSMFRAILAENGISDANDFILQQEMVMFFNQLKLNYNVEIKLIVLLGK